MQKNFLKNNYAAFLGILFLTYFPCLGLYSKTEEKHFIENTKSSNNKKLQELEVIELNILNNVQSIQNFSNFLIDNKLVNSVLNNEKLRRFVDIESNSKYEEKNKFVAEGDVVLYLSNAILRSDLVTYDRESKEFIAEGNVVFSKGKQFFEASKISYNLNSGKGYINDVYGVLDVANFDKDFELNSNIENKYKDLFDRSKIRNLNYINTTKFGLVSDLETGKRYEIKDVNFDIPSINRWRFKTDKLLIEGESIKSKRIFFSNDPFNKPQFLLFSKNFSAQVVNDKIKLVSKNTWVNFDNKFKFPIGRWSVYDRNTVSSWSIGSDYEDKDGIYISRSYEGINFFDDNISLKIQPFVLIQRAINGDSKSFRAPKSSIFSEKTLNETSFSDYFGLAIDLVGKINSWDLEMNSSLNTFNFERLSEAGRAKITLSNSINLNNDKLNTEGTEEKNNYLDIQLYSAFRQDVPKGYSGEEEIYFANGLSLSNSRNWITKEELDFNLSLIYDVGQYRAKKKNTMDLDPLFRNVFALNINSEIPIWKRNLLPETINDKYKFTPKIIKPKISWVNNINSGIFLYGNGDSQKGVSFNTGPRMIFGNLKNNFFDFTEIGLTYTNILKSGKSPFNFDDINDDTRIRFEASQQIFGPLLFSYESYLPLDNDHTNFGEIIDPIYKLQVKRRAYAIGLFYEEKDESFGFTFNIFNFDYSGSGKKF